MTNLDLKALREKAEDAVSGKLCGARQYLEVFDAKTVLRLIDIAENAETTILAFLHRLKEEGPSEEMMEAARVHFADADAILNLHALRTGSPGVAWKDGKPPLWHAINEALSVLISKLEAR